MLKRVIRQMIINSPLEPWARNLYSRLNRSCAESTAEMRDNPQMKAIMQRVLKADSSCLDIGANTGDMLTWIANFAPRGEHHAFEPIPGLAEDLVRRFPQVRVHQAALSDVAGTAQFNYIPSLTGHSSLKLNAKEAAISEQISVRLEVLDDILPQNYHPVLVKIDVEGAEYAALRGGLKVLKRARPYILFEFGKMVQRFDVTPPMMYRLLCNDLGLHISRLNDFLEDRSPLTMARFERIFRQGLLWNFIAHPN